jgi:hypothetical protein
VVESANEWLSGQTVADGVSDRANGRQLGDLVKTAGQRCDAPTIWRHGQDQHILVVLINELRVDVNGQHDNSSTGRQQPSTP